MTPDFDLRIEVRGFVYESGLLPQKFGAVFGAMMPALNQSISVPKAFVRDHPSNP